MFLGTILRGEILKKIIKRLCFTIVFASILFVTVLLKPELIKTEEYEGQITQKLATNFSGAYSNISKFEVEKIKQQEKEEEERKLRETLVYEDLNKEQLISLINKSLNSTISGKGESIVEYSLQYGADPVVATAIMLLETGCKWSCSALVKNCYNVGGVKGKPNCSGGYRKYDSLDDGIKKFIQNLGENYYAKGLDTPEKMNKKYAASSKWAEKVNKYVAEIKSKK